MNIIVLNGSPKGDCSVTMQYVAYLRARFPEVSFTQHNVAQLIRKLETNQAAFDALIEEIRQCDGVLWAFPLYVLIVHAHYKRFIELAFERGAQSAFAGKHAASLSTSIHFFDHTAHNYVRGIAEDLGMRFVEAFSPDMNDLLKPEGQKQTLQFGERFLSAIRRDQPCQRQYAPVQARAFTYQPGPAPAARSTAKKVVVVHDGARGEGNALRMAERCAANFGGDVQVFDLNQIHIAASCQGCLKCGGNYECAFTGKDDFIEFYKAQVMAADVLVFAGAVVDRFLSSRWKMLFDRMFFNTHTPRLIGKQLVYVVSGPLSQLDNLQEILLGWAEFQGANVVGFVSDEYGDSNEIDALIDQNMATLLESAEQARTRPMTFLGVGGLKIFRDDIWGRLRLVFAADHRAYAKLGFYRTFPQVDWSTRLMNFFLAPLLSIPRVRAEFNKQIISQMIVPYAKVIHGK